MEIPTKQFGGKKNSAIYKKKLVIQLKCKNKSVLLMEESGSHFLSVQMEMHCREYRKNSLIFPASIRHGFFSVMAKVDIY